MSFFKNKRRFFTVCIASLAISSFGQSKLTFNVDQAKVTVPKELYGVLMERLGRQWSGQGGVFVGTASSIPNVNGMRKDVIDAFVDCGVGAVEWPGGCAANAYAWQNNKAPTNDVGVDRFIQFCKLTGAEAIISGKPRSTDASSNTAFAEYITNTLQYPLKWFKVGNEVWGCGGNMNASTYLPNYTANYTRLRSSAALKNLKIIAAAGSYQGSYSWIPTYYSSIGSQMDAIESHDYIYYPDQISSTNPTTANYWTIMSSVMSTSFGKHLVNDMIPLMNTADPNKRVKIALDEWGDWLMDTGDGWMQQNTVMDAVSAGLHMNIITGQADRVGLACMSMGVNVIHSLININTSSVMSKTPTFYVFKLLKPHHSNSAKLVPITSKTIENVNANGTNIPVLNATASVDASGIVSVSFANTDLTNARKVTVTLTSTKSAYTIRSAQVVTGTSHTSTNNFGAAEQVNIKTLSSSNYSISGKTLNVTLPTKSVVMIRLNPPTVLPGGPTDVQSDLMSNRPETILAKAGTKGSINVSSLLNRETPVTIALYRADGKTLVRNMSAVLQAGKSTLDLGSNGAGVYIVKITGQGVNLTSRVIAAR